MTYKKFTPERGQLFWFIREITTEEGLPDLNISYDKYSPYNKEHKKFIKNGNCYLTEDEAYESLL